MPETMVERVEQAIVQAEASFGGEKVSFREIMESAFGEDGMDVAIVIVAPALARAALQALRDPTEAMGFGLRRLPRVYRPGSHSALEIYRAMIDAALNEGAER